MNGKGLKNPIFLFYLLVFYVLMQFLWWLYLIFSLYGDVYHEAGEIRHKVIMLIGEGSVFLLILIIGMMMIRRAFKREVEVSQLQQNFLLSVTHELKSPIASIKLFLQTLKSRQLEENKKIELYDQSIKELERLDNLVGNILLARSIDNQNFFLTKSAIRLDEVTEKIISPLKQGILRNHLLTAELEEIEYTADPEAIKSICTNLLENAAKYAPEKSSIHLKLARQDDQILLTVCDQGKGIDDENKKRVFEKFRRIENEMTRKSKGTGLGLYIVKYLVEQHNGSILLKDNHPQGLCVEIRFES